MELSNRVEKRTVRIGLDCSSKKMGVGIVDVKSKELLKYETVKLDADSMFKNVEIIEEWFYPIEPQYIIQEIVIEDYLMGFSGGTSQHTLMLLCQINTLLEFTLMKKQFSVRKINVQTARKEVFGKARVNGKKPKEYVFEQVMKLYPEIIIELGRTGKPKAGTDDFLDAIVLACTS